MNAVQVKQTKQICLYTTFHNYRLVTNLVKMVIRKIERLLCIYSSIKN